jgi:hypothetical protein
VYRRFFFVDSAITCAICLEMLENWLWPQLAENIQHAVGLFRGSQCPRSLRRGSAAACLLGLWVRIPLAAWTPALVSVVCCQVEVTASGLSLVRRSPVECGVSECDCEASMTRKPRPTMGCCAMVLSTK